MKRARPLAGRRDGSYPQGNDGAKPGAVPAAYPPFRRASRAAWAESNRAVSSGIGVPA